MPFRNSYFSFLSTFNHALTRFQPSRPRRLQGMDGAEQYNAILFQLSRPRRLQERSFNFSCNLRRENSQPVYSGGLILPVTGNLVECCGSYNVAITRTSSTLGVENTRLFSAPTFQGIMYDSGLRSAIPRDWENESSLSYWILLLFSTVFRSVVFRSLRNTCNIPLIHHYVNTFSEKMLTLFYHRGILYTLTREVVAVSVAADKIRTNITFPVDLKAKLDELAKKQNRSFNNLVITVLMDYAANQ